MRVDGKCSESSVWKEESSEVSTVTCTVPIIVMNPLLKQLQEYSLGLSIINFYAGGILHTYDIRTIAMSNDSLQKQVTIVRKFASENFLRLNVQKCEVVMFGTA